LNGLKFYASRTQNSGSAIGYRPGNPGKRERPVHGRPQKRKVLLTEQQVAECRDAHERLGERAPVLARRYGTSIHYMYTLLNYQTRSLIVPRKP
jgi:H2-forming N5,N10-methylenetetrahydromethanopterin dehydrogenase-like enzyme